MMSIYETLKSLGIALPAVTAQIPFGSCVEIDLVARLTEEGPAR